MKRCKICDRSYADDVRVCEFDGTVLTASGPKKDPFVGRSINDRYHVLEKLGEGGMSVVYLAEQINIERKVALKVLHGEYAHDEIFVRRFRQEAKLAASLNHRNIIQIYDFDQAEDGNLFIAMEYLLGKTLKGFMRDGAPGIATVVHLAIQIAEGLAAAHRAGVIHRDIKPENMMIVGEGSEVKIMDFGIARLREADAATRLTRAGSIMGTPAYMAPEQIEGKDITNKTDIYAFGIVLYEMLTNTVPFTAPTPAAVLIKHLKDAPVPVRKLRRDIPAHLERIVAQALEKRPERRPAKMEDMAGALRKAALEFPAAPLKPATTTITPLPKAAADPPPVAATAPIQATVAINDEISAFESLPKRVTAEQVSEIPPADEPWEQPGIAATVALTQPVAAIETKRARLKWLLIGAGTLPVIILAVWAAVGWHRQAADENRAGTTARAVPEPPPGKTMTAAVISAGRQELSLNERTALKLSAQYSDGSSEEVKEKVDWISSNPSVLSLSADGSAEAKAAGKTQISARYKGIDAQPLEIRVANPESQEPPAAPQLVSLAIQAPHREVNVNGRLALRARGKYSDGKESELKTVRWESSNSAIADVNAKGELLGQREGKVQVIARSGDIASEPMRVTVRAVMPDDTVKTKETKPAKSIAKKPEPTGKDDQKVKTAQSREQIKMARVYRERGEYAQAFAVLDKAGKIDPRNTEIQDEIAITKRACMAERTLGRPDLNCQ